MEKAKRNYARKAPSAPTKIDGIIKEFDNAIKILNVFKEVYGDDGAVNALKAHLPTMIASIEKTLE